MFIVYELRKEIKSLLNKYLTKKINWFFLNKTQK